MTSPPESEPIPESALGWYESRDSRHQEPIIVEARRDLCRVFASGFASIYDPEVECRFGETKDVYRLANRIEGLTFLDWAELVYEDHPDADGIMTGKIVGIDAADGSRVLSPAEVLDAVPPDMGLCVERAMRRQIEYMAMFLELEGDDPALHKKRFERTFPSYLERAEQYVDLFPAAARLNPLPKVMGS